MNAETVLNFLLDLQKQGHSLNNLFFAVEGIDSSGAGFERSVVDINLHRCTSSVVLEIPEQ